MTMKKIILASVLSTAAAASISTANAATAATNVCTGTAGSGTITLDVTATNEFVKTAFTPKCSANVLLVFDQGQTYFRTGSASIKGGRSFRGTTAGGAVQSHATCTPCAVSDATTARDSTYNPTTG